MEKKIAILGGDLRIIRLAEILAEDDYIVYTYGLEKYKFLNSNILKCKNIQDIINNCENIISGIPFSRDEISIYTPFSDKLIIIEETLKNLCNKKIIAGAIKQKTKEIAYKNNVQIIDIMENESLTILNVIPTVEGAIQIAMENTEITIHDSNLLILGFGRIGKLLSKSLKSLGANVSCVARKDKDLALIKAYGYKGIHINDLYKNLNNYDIIFNTIPSVILDYKKLELIKDKNTLIIDLASSPGGVDYDKAEEYNIKTIKALGLPGKHAPLTTARYIKETLEKILNNR